MMTFDAPSALGITEPERVCTDTPWNIGKTLPPAAMHGSNQEQRRRAAELNDAARGAMDVACIVETTAQFRRLSAEDQSQIRAAVARYDLWTIAEGHGANRDFGVIFKHADGIWSQETPRGGDPIEAIFWRIVCLDRTQTQVSQCPWDETRSIRVLTLMCAEEY